MTTTELQNKIQHAIDNYSDTSRTYEVNLTKIVNTDFKINIAMELLEILKKSNKMDEAYAVFYCINIYHRNLFNNDDLDKLWKIYSKDFEKYDSFEHLKINRFRISLLPIATFSEQEEYLKLAYKNKEKYADNAGYIHAFSALFANIIEKNENNLEFREKILKDWNPYALDAVNEAITLDYKYAKYYCTKGRILSAYCEYDKADKAICKAIAMENSTRTDYAVRINDYQYYRLQNQIQKQKALIDEEQKSIDNLSRSIVSNIETIALFSGIISFVLGSLKLVDGETAVQACLLIFTLMGCLSAVFSIFILLLHLGDKNYNNKVAINIILVSIIFSIIATILSGVF